MRKQGRFEEAVSLQRAALETIRGQLGDDHAKVARATTALSRELQNVGRYDEARELRERVAGFWEKETGRELLRYARVLVPAENVGRRVSGRVVDSRGEPVDGAEVSVGSLLFGDGKYADTTRGSQSFRVWRARTGPDGRFEMSGVTGDVAAAIAEHDDLGRSLPARVARARDVADLGLELRPFGRLEGAVRFRGERPPVVRVHARAIESELGGAAAVFGVALRPDDRYVFERLAAGRYAVTLSANAVQAQAGIQTREVVVRPGETVRLESVFDQDGRTVEIEVVSEAGGTIPVAQVLVFRGRHDYATVGELRALGSRLKELGEIGWVYPGRPARLPGVEPGQNTVCAIPLPGDPKNPEVARQMEKHEESFPSHCQPFDLETGTGIHSLTMRVPATEMPADAASE